MVVLADSRVDPQASSPAGAVYEIPLQTARDFGSPGGAGGAGGGAATGGGSGGGAVLPVGSAIKSENGYGSSSQVPGLSATAAAKAKRAAKSSAAGATTGAAAAAAKVADTAQEEASAASAPRIDPKPTASEAPSRTGTYGLVILIALGGAAAGVAASLAARSSFGQRS